MVSRWGKAPPPSQDGDRISAALRGGSLCLSSKDLPYPEVGLGSTQGLPELGLSRDWAAVDGMYFVEMFLQGTCCLGHSPFLGSPGAGRSQLFSEGLSICRLVTGPQASQLVPASTVLRFCALEYW